MSRSRAERAIETRHVCPGASSWASPRRERLAHRSPDTVHPRVAETAMLQMGYDEDISPLAHLSDDELLVEVAATCEGERQATAQLIASLAELDARRLYLGQGCSSLFTYCTQVLRLSEHAAYGRIEAARAARRFPVVVELLGEWVGELDHGRTAGAAPDAAEPSRAPRLGMPQKQAGCRAAGGVSPPSAGGAVNRAQAAVSETAEAVRPDPSLFRTRTLSPAPCPAPPPPRPAFVGPLAPDGTRFSSRCRATRMTNCAGPRTSCGIRFRAATRRRSSIGRRRCFWRIWKRGNSPPQSGHEQDAGLHRVPATSRRRSNARSGLAMVDSAPSGQEQLLHGTSFPGIPLRCTVRRGWCNDGRESRTAMPEPQQERGEVLFRPAARERDRASWMVQLGPDRVDYWAQSRHPIEACFCVPPPFAHCRRRQCRTRDRSCRSAVQPSTGC